MDEVQEQFDDPALRGMLRRAIGHEPAPSALREKVTAMMATAGPAPVSRKWPWQLRGFEMPVVTWRTAAVAALVLVVLGYAGMQVHSFVDEFYPSSAGPRPPAKFAMSFATSVVASHEHCAHLNDHHLVPGDEFEKLRAQLSEEGQISAFAGAIEGWTFKGAGKCKVGDAASAHLLYARGSETASVFCLEPSTEYGCVANSSFEQVQDHDAVVGATHGGTLYVVVLSNAAHTDASLADAKGILSAIGAQTDCCTGAPRAATAASH